MAAVLTAACHRVNRRTGSRPSRPRTARTLVDADHAADERRQRPGVEREQEGSRHRRERDAQAPGEARGRVDGGAPAVPTALLRLRLTRVGARRTGSRSGAHARACTSGAHVRLLSAGRSGSTRPPTPPAVRRSPPDAIVSGVVGTHRELGELVGERHAGARRVDEQVQRELGLERRRRRGSRRAAAASRAMLRAAEDAGELHLAEARRRHHRRSARRRAAGRRRSPRRAGCCRS